MQSKFKTIILAVIVAVSVLVGIFLLVKYNKPSTSVQNKGLPVEDLYTKNLNDLLKIVQNQDPNIALHELQHRMDTDPYVFKNCHALAHEIGHAGYKKYNDFAVAMSYQVMGLCFTRRTTYQEH